MTNEQLVDRLVSAINGWSETELKMSFDNDGDGHMDFSRMKVTEQGHADLLRVIEEACATPDALELFREMIKKE